jgi:hypothetical protein
MQYMRLCDFDEKRRAGLPRARIDRVVDAVEPIPGT